MGPYEQMENIQYEKRMGEHRMLALQIHKRIVSVKGGNCSEGEKQGQRRVRRQMRKQVSEIVTRGAGTEWSYASSVLIFLDCPLVSRRRR